MLSFLLKWRIYFVYCGIFSFVISLLQLTIPIFNMLIFDKALMSNSVPTLVAIVLMATGTLLASALLDVVRNRLLVRLGIQMDIDLSDRVFMTMVQEIACSPQGQTTASLRDVTVLRNYLSGAAIFNFFDLPLVPICLLLITALHPLLGLVALGGGLLSIGLGVIAERLTRKTLDQASIMSNRSSHLASQATRNAEAVMSMSMRPGILARWKEINNEVMNLQTLASQRAGLLQALIRALRMFMQIALYGAGAYLVITGGASFGVMIGAGLAMGKALGPIDAAVATYAQSLEALAAYKRLCALFGQPPEPERMDMPTPQGNLTCEAVSYLTGGRLLLQSINLQLTAGQSMGLIGPSAAGKSTLCRVLVGVWQPSRGVVRLDGVDIQAWDMDKRGAFVGYLPQDVELFSGTVAQNIARLGRVDSEKVIMAAKLAGAHEMILQFPNGYDTEIGTGGAILSGGQRQRIGLARALFGQPRLLVLDEPSSNLDDDGERALAMTLQYLKKLGTTVIIVSHKPATIANVDMLMVLKQGQVVLFGPREIVFRQLVGGSGVPASAPPRPLANSPA